MKLSNSKLWKVLFSGPVMFLLFLLFVVLRLAVPREVLILFVTLPTLFFVCRFLAQCLATVPPEFRKREPSTVWLLFIPFFNFIWAYFVLLPLARGYQAYFRSRGRNDVNDCGYAFNLAFCISLTISLHPRLRALGVAASVILLAIVLLMAWYYKRLIERDTVPAAVDVTGPVRISSKAEIPPVHTIDEVLESSVKTRFQPPDLRPVTQGNQISVASEPSLARSSPQPFSTPSPSLPVTSLDSPSLFDPDELVLGQYTVCAFGNSDALATLVFTSRCLRVVFPAVGSPASQPMWSIQFSDITQAKFRHQQPTDPVSLTLVSKTSICGPVPVDLRSEEWLGQNRGSVSGGQIGLDEFTVYSGGQTTSQKLVFSYRLPEAWFFDESGCCLSVFIVNVPPEEVGKLFARLLAIRDAGNDSPTYVADISDEKSIVHWRSGENEPLLWQWQANEAKGPKWATLGLEVLNILAPKIYLTNRRLILEFVRFGRVVELSDFPIEALRSICWFGNGGQGEVRVCIDGPELHWPARITATQRGMQASGKPLGVTGFMKHLADLNPSYTSTTFDLNAPGTSSAIESLGAMIVATRQGLPAENVSGAASGNRTGSGAGEELVCTPRLSSTLDVKTELRLTNRRLCLHAIYDPAPLSKMLKPYHLLAAPWLAPLLITGGVSKGRIQYFAHCEVFIDHKTRISTLPINKAQCAFIVGWGSDTPDVKQLAQAVSQMSIVLRLQHVCPVSIQTLKAYSNCFILPADRQEAETVAATLNRNLMAVQRGVK
jgi:hypothetical protein